MSQQFSAENDRQGREIAGIFDCCCKSPKCQSQCSRVLLRLIFSLGETFEIVAFLQDELMIEFLAANQIR